jgi:hypothetical protein
MQCLPARHLRESHRWQRRLRQLAAGGKYTEGSPREAGDWMIGGKTSEQKKYSDTWSDKRGEEPEKTAKNRCRGCLKQEEPVDGWQLEGNEAIPAHSNCWRSSGIHD